ncbi:hypothetical protein BKA83DRAFT_509122 [Pisolithus microcarpus]|nr:hypothetical protein BKA83DRAFT_509122 [Pisolithus microcarpus]
MSDILSLNCLVWDDVLDHLFTVELPSTENALADGGHTKLFPLRALSKVFDQPLVVSGLHVLVKPPSTSTISLNCLVLGDTRNHIFTIELAISANVGVLRKAIKKEKQPYFNNVDADELSLYRTSLPDDGELEGKLRSLNFDEPLQPTSILAEIFPDLPVASHLHIVVQPPHEEQNDILTELNECCEDRCSTHFIWTIDLDSFQTYHHIDEKLPF